MTDETFGTAADFFAAEDAKPKLDEQATRIARNRQARGIAKLHAAFGVAAELDEEGKLLPPPPRVMAVLVSASVGGRKAHGARAIKRAAKRRRYRANGRRGELNGYRANAAWLKRLESWTLDSCAYSEETHRAHVRKHGRCVGCHGHGRA